MAQHNDTGRQGEDEAIRYLQRKGYDILERNYRHQHAEIDLIAQLGKLMVFVEVKTRSNTRFGNPETFVNYTKARLVMKAAEHYLFAKDWPYDVRFDVVAVTVLPDQIAINHIEDAFY
ncbi:YraN family protein [Larkinella harenae]